MASKRGGSHGGRPHSGAKEMTTEDDLVERVAEILRVQGRTHGYCSIIVARAAIAECEAHTERAAVSLADKFDAKLVKLEAQCAAMRAALETAKLQVITLHPGHDPRGEEYADQIQIEVLDAIDAALLPDAGQKVLAVVRAAARVDRLTDESLAPEHILPALDVMNEALSALGWRP